MLFPLCLTFFSYFVTDPFFPLSFLVNSWFPGMLDDLFQSLFLCALLLFWLCVYHGIRVQVRVQHYLLLTEKTLLVFSTFILFLKYNVTHEALELKRFVEKYVVLRLPCLEIDGTV